jgi:Tfp pilus assembly protein PilF/TolB-like protein
VFLVFPFENASRSARYDWLSEGLEELTIERLGAAGLRVFTREERYAELERYGLPASGKYSRAMMLRVAEDLDADYIVFGSYNTDGKNLGIDAELLRVHPAALRPAVQESGALVGVMDVHMRAVWRLLSASDPRYPLSQAEFTRRQRPLRLDAFEHYVRGLLATEDEQKIRSLREAARLEPTWTAPAFSLAHVYFTHRDCLNAIAWLGRVPPTDGKSTEAAFLLGVCRLYRNEADLAVTVFQTLANRLRRAYGGSYELPELLNNLAVAQARNGKFAESESLLERVRQLDPDDQDYSFNLALLKLRANRPDAAVAALRDAVSREPEDNEARALLVAALERSGQKEAAATERTAAPADFRGKSAASLKPEALARLDRIKTRLDTSVLKLAPEAGSEDTAASNGTNSNSASHAKRARQLLTAGKVEEAGREFQAALKENPKDAGARRGLAEVYRRQGRLDEAAKELQASLSLRDGPTARTELARLYLEQKKPELARAELERALRIAPGYAEARQLLSRLSGNAESGVRP